MAVDATPLIESCAQRGARWSALLEVREGPRGRGVFAKQAIAHNDLLLRLPLSMMIHPPDKLAEMVASGECSKILALALTVVHGLHVSSPRTKFFDLLAASPPPDLPMLWDSASLEHLSGTSLLPPDVRAADVAAAAERIFEEDVRPMMVAAGETYLPTATHRRDIFTAALAWVSSRTLQGRMSYEHGAAGAGGLLPYLRADGPPTSSKPGGVGPFLLPLFDLINHSTEPAPRNTILERVDGDGRADGDGNALDAFEMRATRDIAAGQEVVHSYGDHGPAELLRTYGFIDSSRHVGLSFAHDEVTRAATSALARAGVALSARDAQQRLGALARAGRLPPLFTVRGGAPGTEGPATQPAAVPTELLTAVQVLCLDAEEYSGWLEAGSIWLGIDFLDDECLPVVQDCLLRLADDRLRTLAAGCGDDHGENGDGGGGGVAAELGQSLRAAEGTLLRDFKKGALLLDASLGAEGETEEEGEEDEDEDEDEDEEEEEEEELVEDSDTDSSRTGRKRIRVA